MARKPSPIIDPADVPVESSPPEVVTPPDTPPADPLAGLYAVFGANEVLPCGLIYLSADAVPDFGLAYDEDRAKAGLPSGFMRPGTQADMVMNRGQVIADRRAPTPG